MLGLVDHQVLQVDSQLQVVVSVTVSTLLVPMTVSILLVPVTVSALLVPVTVHC